VAGPWLLGPVCSDAAAAPLTCYALLCLLCLLMPWVCSKASHCLPTPLPWALKGLSLRLCCCCLLLLLLWLPWALKELCLCLSSCLPEGICLLWLPWPGQQVQQPQYAAPEPCRDAACSAFTAVASAAVPLGSVCWHISVPCLLLLLLLPLPLMLLLLAVIVLVGLLLLLGVVAWCLVGLLLLIGA
jgi:hypothetical protein